jgi:hypothetical protein
MILTSRGRNLTPPTSPQQVMYTHTHLRARETSGAPLTYQIPDDDDRDGPRNVGFIQTHDAADSPRRLHRSCTPVCYIPLERVSRDWLIDCYRIISVWRPHCLSVLREIKDECTIVNQTKFLLFIPLYYFFLFTRTLSNKILTYLPDMFHL